MFRALLLVFIILPIVEIWLLIQVGGWIGAPLTILAVLATAVIGVAWLRIQGFTTLNRFNQRISRGEMPSGELLEGVLLIVAGAFLLTPGFATDSVGFALLIPSIRQSFAQWAVRFVLVGQIGSVHSAGPGSAGTRGQQQARQSENRSDSDPVVIEGEFQRVNDKEENEER